MDLPSAAAAHGGTPPGQQCRATDRGGRWAVVTAGTAAATRKLSAVRQEEGPMGNATDVAVDRRPGERPGEHIISSAEERRVIIASSVGTVFEWYDFYLYAVLAPFFAGLFFPKGNQTAALLFGRIGDLVGRKYTFLITIVVMGLSTVLVGFLPTFETIAWGAPIILVVLRLAQGLALGGEYGGAATYVAEHAPDHKRGYATSWIQTTATLGMLMALIVIGITRVTTNTATFAQWAWRIPFLVSIPLLAISIYIRLKLQESPIFQRMKAQGKRSKHPIKESFFHYPNNKYVGLALLGATAGQGVVWYTGQFYALFFLLIYLKLDFIPTYTLIGLSLAIGTPFFLVFGALSDRIGRKKIILAGCLLAALTYMPLFRGLTHFVNPDLEAYRQRTAIELVDTDCTFNIFIGPWSRQTPCDRAKDFLGKAGLSFASVPAVAGEAVVTKIGDLEIRGWDEAKYKQALSSTGYPAKADPNQVNWFMAELLIVIM